MDCSGKSKSKIMNMRIAIGRSFLSLFLVMPFLIACGDEEHEGAVGTERMEQGTLQPDGEGGWTSEDASNTGDGNVEVRTGSKENDVDRDRAARASIENDLKELRGPLEKELEQVRDRLNQGTSTALEQEKDQARAGELAHDLAELDRIQTRIDNEGDAQEIRNELRDLREHMKEKERNTDR